jgi:pyocin large subunit-like protein
LDISGRKSADGARWFSHPKTCNYGGAAHLQYAEAARSLASNPPVGALIKSRGADTLIYNQATNTFLVRSANGAARTMFRPKNGINYWNSQ